MSEQQKDMLIAWFDNIKQMADKRPSNNLKEVLEAISAYAEMCKEDVKNMFYSDNLS